MPKTHRGFTLIEVVVAMLVFAIIATGFLMTLTAGLVTTRDTRTRIVAANLASQQIDLIRSQDVFDVTSSTDVAKVSVIGVGMRSHAGVAAQMFKALADKGINIQLITTSEIKTSVLIEDEYAELIEARLLDDHIEEMQARRQMLAARRKARR